VRGRDGVASCWLFQKHYSSDHCFQKWLPTWWALDPPFGFLLEVEGISFLLDSLRSPRLKCVYLWNGRVVMTLSYFYLP